MKKMVIGLIIGLTIGYAASAYAAVGDTVSAVFANFSYMVNGTSKAIDAPVLVYEGTSYVRTTDIGNMLGFDVTYKSDSRTIAFSNGTQTPISTPSPSPISQPVTVTNDAYGATPTPTVDVTPAPSTAPSATPSVEPTASPDPNASPTPTVEPTPSPTPAPTPTPTPSNTAQCQSIKNNYTYQIVMVGYEGGSQGQHLQKILVLEYQRDQELAAAGCQ